MASFTSIAEPIARPASEPAPARIVVIRVGDRTHGLPVAAVREILPFRGATRLPGAPPAIVGVVAVRGAILTVVDLGRHLGGATAAAEEPLLVIVGHGARALALLVDAVEDVVDSAAGDGGDRAALAEGAAAGRSGDQVVFLIDIASLFAHVLA